MRNLQLAVGGSAVAWITAYVAEGSKLFSSPLEGFSKWAWTVMFLHVIAGFLVAVCLKYGDAIVKNFATACSLALTVLLSWPTFGEPTTLAQAVGTAVIIASIYTYTRPQPTLPTSAPQRHAETEPLRKG